MNMITQRTSRSLVRRLYTKTLSIKSRLTGFKLPKRLRHQLFRYNNKNARYERYFIEKNGNFEKKSDYAVVLHLYHPESWSEVFSPKLLTLSAALSTDLYITMPQSNKKYVSDIRHDFPAANILIVPNKGRDVLPFIKVASLLDTLGYKKVLKIHSKKSVHRETSNTASAGGGDVWLNNTLEALIPDDKTKLKNILKKLNSNQTGMIGPSEYFYPIKMYLRHNREIIQELLYNEVDSSFFSASSSEYIDTIGFFGGTMFWVDLSSISTVLNISSKNFQSEQGQFDRTTAHALERVFCILPQLKRKDMIGSSRRGIVKIENSGSSFPDWYFGDVSGGRPQISIIVPVYADWQSLAINIKSLIKEVGNSEDVSVHYVNDCGPDADILEKDILNSITGLTNFYYHRNPQNLGFVQTCNRAVLKLVNQKDDVLLLNSDTKVTKNFLIEMRKTLYSEPKIAATTSRSNNATIWSVPMTSRLANYKSASYTLYRLIKRKLPERYITPTIHGFCVLIRREVINKYGLFDEIYGKGYGEENDFAMRLRSKGWKCAVANHSYVFHYESRSFGKDVRNAQIERNEKILLERYPNYRNLVQEYWDGIEEPFK
ncbi:MAG TPA: rhamnan synthesis F family protein [Candidatus Saccharimonadales bacterium]|jgi:GT2 family glycosyltransferase